MQNVLDTSMPVQEWIDSDLLQALDRGDRVKSMVSCDVMGLDSRDS